VACPVHISGRAARSWPAPVTTARSPPGEAFIPDGSPYLGQTILGEPLRQSNVLSRTGDYRDETSIGCGHA
jgi:hypothetical protein